MKTRTLWWAALCLAATLHAQEPLEQDEIAVGFDSGEIVNHGEVRDIVYSDVLIVPDAPWIRLALKETVLGRAPEGGKPTMLVITSLRDGGVQTLEAKQLMQWRYTSAYFNGDSVRIEVAADPGASPSRIAVDRTWFGLPLTQEGRRGSDDDRSICGTIDDRQLSFDDRVGRIVPIGCTAWLFDDANHCFLTAGHCDTASAQVVEFNVPLSNPDGSTNHPGPEDQYPIDGTSFQSQNGGTGNDWGYFGTFENATTGLTPFEAQGAFHTLADPPASPDGQTIDITGYGTTTSTTADNTWSQVQTTHEGDFVLISGTLLRYAVDTTGGDSGSPVLHEDTGNAIGIHTHAGCNTGGGSNQGTNSIHPNLQTALLNPLGVCAPPPLLEFTFPNGLPDVIAPAGGTTVRVEIAGINGGVPQPGTGMLGYDIGEGLVEIPMNVVSTNVYDAVFPAIDCGNVVNYQFSAETTGAEVEFSPEDAPQIRYATNSAESDTTSFEDDFEADMGWTVTDGPSLTSGTWERGVPAGGGLRSDPPTDADGSGSCFLTQNEEGNSDVDGGHTVLTSPVMDAGSEAVITYWRWYANDGDDTFLVEVSEDGGDNWVTLETVGPIGFGTSGGWIRKSFRVADFVTPNNQFRIRFDVSDEGTGSVVEAGIDGVQLVELICAGCFGDLDGNQMVDMTDLLLATGDWLEHGMGFDGNGDDRSDVSDLVVITNVFGPCEGP